jgi:hypothetical protein
MALPSQRAALDRFVGWLCRSLLALFFRRVEVVGAERIPESGPFRWSPITSTAGDPCSASARSGSARTARQEHV